MSLTNERSWEIWEALCATIPEEKPVEERERLRKESEERRDAKDAERYAKLAKDRAAYDSDPPQLRQRLNAFMECVAFYDHSLEERIEAEVATKKYEFGLESVTNEEITDLIRAMRLHNAKELGVMYGARFDEVHNWMRYHWPGIPEKDVKLTADDAIRGGIAIERPDGAIFDHQRRYEITEKGRSFVKGLSIEHLFLKEKIPDWIHELGWKVQDLVRIPGAMQRFREMLRAEAVEQNDELLPLSHARPITLTGKYAVLSAIYDFSCKGVEKVNRAYQRGYAHADEAVEWIRQNNRSVAAWERLLEHHIPRMTVQDREAMQAILADVADDMKQAGLIAELAIAGAKPNLPIDAPQTTALAPIKVEKQGNSDGSGTLNVPAPVSSAAEQAVPNPSAPFSLGAIADAWGGEMTAKKLGPMIGKSVKGKRLGRQTWIVCLDDIPLSAQKKLAPTPPKSA